jgi:hypothetical protein
LYKLERNIVAHVARRGRREMRIGFRCEKLKEKDCHAELDVDGRIILKAILNK